MHPALFGPEPDTAAVALGWDLRSSANELARLTNEFTNAVPSPAAAQAPQTAAWLRGAYPESIEALQTQLSTEALLNTPPARDLLSACGRLRAMALHPDDANLRGAVLAEVRNALDAVDRYLKDTNLQRRIALPVTPLR